jgi:PadR family transcriptional regulator, regulatory protein PadR
VSDLKRPERESAVERGPTDVPWSPRNLLVPYLLLALSAYRAHGYLLQEYLRGLGFFGVDTTTIYRNLRQLEKQGLVSSTWDTGDQGPARRVYTLTDAGQEFLGNWAGALGQYRSFLDQFFSMYNGAGAPQPPDPPKEESP